jgi:plasmid stability protein
MKTSKRATIYFDPGLHAALRLKAAHSDRTISELVNDAVRAALAEDQEDLKAFEDRVAEPTMTYEALLDDLKANGRL